MRTKKYEKHYQILLQEGLHHTIQPPLDQSWYPAYNKMNVLDVTNM